MKWGRTATIDGPRILTEPPDRAMRPIESRRLRVVSDLCPSFRPWQTFP